MCGCACVCMCADFANAGFDKDDLEDLKDDMESE
jgi:hypothetical protein